MDGEVFDFFGALLVNDALVGLLGVVTGFVLSEAAVWRRTRRAERRQRKALLSMLSNEVDFNLSLLELYVAAFSDDAQEVSMDGVVALYKHIFPGWNREVWQSQLPLLAVSLTPVEVNFLSLFYYNLDFLRQRLNNPHALSGGAKHSIKQPLDVARRMIEAGNPLRKELNKSAALSIIFG